MYTNEPNWYNEICCLMEEYGLEFNEETISSMSKIRWKELVSTAIHHTVFESLYADCISKSKTANVPRYESFSQQDYFQFLSPSKARIFFQLRAGIYDVKENRPYMHNNVVCRLCQSGSESIDHVINHCGMINRSDAVLENLFVLSEEETYEVLARIDQFEKLVKNRQ